MFDCSPDNLWAALKYAQNYQPPQDHPFLVDVAMFLDTGLLPEERDMYILDNGQGD